MEMAVLEMVGDATIDHLLNEVLAMCINDRKTNFVLAQQSGVACDERITPPVLYVSEKKAVKIDYFDRPAVLHQFWFGNPTLVGWVMSKFPF